MHVSDLRDDWGVRPRQQVSCSLVLAGLTVQWTQRQSATMRTTPTTECMPHDLWWHHARTHTTHARTGTLHVQHTAHVCTRLHTHVPVAALNSWFGWTLKP